MKLKANHVITLLILLVTVNGFLTFFTPRLVMEQSLFSPLINHTGKQRMLTQKLSADILNYQLTKSDFYLREVKSVLEQFDKVHIALILGDKKLGITPLTQGEALRLYGVADEFWEKIKSAVVDFIEDPTEKNLSFAISRLETNRVKILASLNDLVSHFEANSRMNSDQKIEQLYQIYFVYNAVGMFSILICLLLFKKIKTELKELRSQSENLESASKELTSLSEELTESTLDQESAIQETSASMTEINGIVRKNSDSCETCMNYVVDTSKNFEQAEEAISHLSRILNNVDGSSQDLSNINDILHKIEDKTQVVNDIVIKTQLLSVNASIEAERAGEYGIGFSVVAEEIGKLAQSSGKESKDIRKLLVESISTVNRLVSATQSSAKEGVSSCEMSQGLQRKNSENVSSVIEQISDITDSSQQQSIGVNEVTESIQTISEGIHLTSRVAQMSRALSENISSSGEKLLIMTNELGSILGLREGRKVQERKLLKGRLGKERNPNLESQKVVRELIKNTTKVSDNNKEAKTDLDGDDESFSRKIA